MSHRVTVSIAINVSKEMPLIDRLSKEINECALIYKKHMEPQIDELKVKLESARKDLNELSKINLTGEMEVVEKVAFEYQKKISKIMKEVANLKSAFNYGSVYKEIEIKDRAGINEYIKEYGIMAIMGLEELLEKGKEISENNLKEQIEIKREIKAEKRNINSIKEIALDNLIISNIDDDIKRELISYFDKTDYTRQELMDLTAYFESKIHEYEYMIMMKKDLQETLKSVGFKIKLSKFFVEQDGRLKMILGAHKDNTKDFELMLYSDKKLSWQFGNYENHMCDSDGEKFRDELKRQGIKTSNFVITRNVSRSRPMFKAMKQKERGK